jgi:hypothetical protein
MLAEQSILSALPGGFKMVFDIYLQKKDEKHWEAGCYKFGVIEDGSTPFEALKNFVSELKFQHDQILHITDEVIQRRERFRELD